ncbi:MAG: hypothetical protein ACK5Y1_13575, partial [Betaproteobacteria bacterium]
SIFDEQGPPRGAERSTVLVAVGGQQAPGAIGAASNGCRTETIKQAKTARSQTAPWQLERPPAQSLPTRTGLRG